MQFNTAVSLIKFREKARKMSYVQFREKDKINKIYGCEKWIYGIVCHLF